MIRIIALFLVVIPFCSSSFGQAITSPRVRAQLLNDDDVSDVYSIGNMTFIIRESELINSKIKEADLSKLIPLADAVKRGLPNKETGALIDRLLHGHHEPHLEIASAINYGDAGFYWKLKWYLFPSPGGFSGIPDEYHAVIRQNGTQVKPELYLIDDYRIYSDDPDEVVFSVMALDDLLPATDSKIDIEKIKQAAERKFELARSELNIEPEFQALKPIREVYSGSLASNETNGELEVWLVRFVDRTIRNPQKTNYAHSIAVWVTSDFTTSELTTGQWSANPKRKVAK